MGVDLLGVELERAGQREQLLAQGSGPLPVADLREGGHQPERADEEGPLLGPEAVVGLLDPVAEHQAVHRELVRDRPHRRHHPRVVGGQEAEEGHEEERGVEGGLAVPLREDAALVHAVGADVVLDLLGPCLPVLGQLVLTLEPREAGAAVDRDPAHELGGREVLQRAANLPDALVGLAPRGQRTLHLVDEDRPDALVEPVARLGVEVHRVEHRAPDVVLVLAVRVVADPHRPGALVPLEVELLLGELRPPVDAVHHLEVLVALGDIGDEPEEVVGLPVEAEGVQRPQGEGGVPDPAVAVVPVAPAARRLRERRRRRGHERPRRSEREPLQGQRAALQVPSPRMVREVAPGQPVLPVVRRPHEALVGLVRGRRRRVLAPRQGAEAALALLEQRARRRPATFDADAEVGGQRQLEVVAGHPGDGLLVGRTAVDPLDRDGARSRTSARSP